MTSGWKKRQVADKVAEDNKPNLGELLRAKLDAIDKEQRPNTPKYMSTQQVLDMTPHDVYMLVRTGEWLIEDFVEWVYACETYAFKTGVEEGGQQ